MSWTRDKEDDLVNLDHIEALQIMPVGDSETVYTLMAVTGVDEEGHIEGYRLCEGSQQTCLSHLDKLAAKLPKVGI